MQAPGWMINPSEAAQQFPQNFTPAELAALESRVNRVKKPQLE
jgi:hypothetical protein